MLLTMMYVAGAVEHEHNPGIMPPLQCEPGCTRMTGHLLGAILKESTMTKKNAMWMLALLFWPAP